MSLIPFVQISRATSVALKSDLGRDVKFRPIAQDAIAKLYMKYMIS